MDERTDRGKSENKIPPYNYAIELFAALPLEEQIRIIDLIRSLLSEK